MSDQEARRRQELEICARKLGVAADSAEARIERARMLREIGSETKSRDIEASELVFAAAIGELEGVVADFPENTTAAETLYEFLTTFGRAAFERDDVALALRRFRPALRIAERLAKPKPHDALAQKRVWMAMMQLVQLPGGDMEWVQVKVRMATAKLNDALAPEDEKILEAVTALDERAQKIQEFRDNLGKR